MCAPQQVMFISEGRALHSMAHSPCPLAIPMWSPLDHAVAPFCPMLWSLVPLETKHTFTQLLNATSIITIIL